MSADFRSFDPSHHRRPPGAPDQPSDVPDDDDESESIIAGDESECEPIPEDGPRVRPPRRGKRLVKPPEGIGARPAHRVLVPVPTLPSRWRRRSGRLYPYRLGRLACEAPGPVDRGREPP